MRFDEISMARFLCFHVAGVPEILSKSLCALHCFSDSVYEIGAVRFHATAGRLY